MKSIAYEIVEKLWKKNRIFCSCDYDESLKYFQEILPFQIHTYQTESPYKGWVVPPRWDLVKATIQKEGKTLFEVDHPLKIIGLSKSFTGTVSLEELKKHLHFDHRDEKRIPYHFRQHYRPWDRDWGFCVTKQFYDSLKPGNYTVHIETKEGEGKLKVAEYVKKGETPYGFAFVAHLDHPGMANDDLAGVAVGVELFKKLSTLKTKFTYRLILVQEIIGSVFYLDKTLNKSEVLEACFLEMLGTKTPLALQSSRLEKSVLEKILEEKLKESGEKFVKGPFRSIICNDEGVWESAQIPMCSLSRYPYPEYHSDSDNISIISPDSLEKAVDILYQTIHRLENLVLIEKQFEGVYALSHPDYNLYVDPGQPAFGDLPQKQTTSLRRLMDDLPLLPKYTFANPLAEELNLPFDVVYQYLKKWEEKKLIKLV